ncbi:MAG: hypothetical protein QGH13_06865 [Candidatus Thalassarchaeaceae archaeon]|jgi:hypothetical protein|nr:hypothetical protein [Candidatus Thalassarchaeaceae archaeon]|tara:strand:+ start:3353 stop:3601 length:249 start_codon:yes stop_codon:yes gene_type:complete
MDSAQLFGWILAIGFIGIFFLGLLWLRGRVIRLDKMLENGDLELLEKTGIKTEVLNHAPNGSQILPYTPYVAIDVVNDEKSL